MRGIQAEHREWVTRWYPNQPKIVPAAGMVEEAGELLHCVLKLLQQDLWGKDARYEEEKLKEKLVDAVGDCAIYLCSLCNACGTDFEALHSLEFEEYGGIDAPLENSVQLVACAARVAEAIQFKAGWVWKLAAKEYILRLKLVCRLFGIDYELAVRATWNHVKGRVRCER